LSNQELKKTISQEELVSQAKKKIVMEDLDAKEASKSALDMSGNDSKSKVEPSA